MSERASEILAWLRAVDVDQPIGQAVEDFVDYNAVTTELVPLFERFLISNDLENRTSALMALVQYGRRYDYAADALLLHMQSRDSFGGSMEERLALTYLYLMQEGGNAMADRIAVLLDRDPYVINMRRGYGDVAGEQP